MRISRTLAAISLSAVTISVGASSASADTITHTYRVSKADKAALKWANRVCDGVRDDYTWEACVTGGVQTKRTRYTIKDGRIVAVRARAFTADDYETGSVLKALHGTRPVGHKVHKSSKRDRAAFADAVTQCGNADVGVTPDLFEQCVFGAFTMDTGRVLTERDVKVSTMTLIHGSHHIK